MTPTVKSAQCPIACRRLTNQPFSPATAGMESSSAKNSVLNPQSLARNVVLHAHASCMTCHLSFTGFSVWSSFQLANSYTQLFLLAKVVRKHFYSKPIIVRSSISCEVLYQKTSYCAKFSISKSTIVRSSLSVSLLSCEILYK